MTATPHHNPHNFKYLVSEGFLTAKLHSPTQVQFIGLGGYFVKANVDIFEVWYGGEVVDFIDIRAALDYLKILPDEGT